MKRKVTDGCVRRAVLVFLAVLPAAMGLTGCGSFGGKPSSPERDTTPTPAVWEKENGAAAPTVSPEEKAAREALVMSALTGVNMVTLDTSGFDDIFIDGMVDQVLGKEILSSGAKSAIQAASDELSLDSILEGAQTGAIEGIQGYVEGKAEGDLTDKIGADIFSSAGLVDEILHADDTSAALANGIADSQELKADELLKVLQATSMTAGDIRNAAESLYQLKSLEAEASAITGNSVEGNKDDLYQRLETISRQYGAENYRILKYAEAEINLVYTKCQ